MEVTFELPSLEEAEQLEAGYDMDAEALCGAKGSEVQGGVGPFGLLVLASSNLEEKTAVLFRVFKAESKHVILMCNDPTRYQSSSILIYIWQSIPTCIYIYHQ